VELGQVARALNVMADRIVRDPLTGLMNRGELVRRLALELEEGSTPGRGVALLMVDVDHFKRVNDTHGHPAGDEVLREVARRLNTGHRDQDLVARFGGEEFALVLPDATREGATSVAERLRVRVAEAPIPAGEGVQVTVTVSVGMAIFPGDGGDPAALTAAADRALYAAKRGGRDRVVAAWEAAGA
jgi:diguanylate cyclase (GGDEF)-like protein